MTFWKNPFLFSWWVPLVSVSIGAFLISIALSPMASDRIPLRHGDADGTCRRHRCRGDRVPALSTAKAASAIVALTGSWLLAGGIALVLCIAQLDSSLSASEASHWTGVWSLRLLFPVLAGTGASVVCFLVRTAGTSENDTLP